MGKWLRKFYEDRLLNKRDANDEIYVQSSSSSRALESAHSCLTGLNPIQVDQISNNNLRQTIPVHSVDKNDDFLIYPQVPTSCKLFYKLFDDLMHSPEIDKFNIKFKNLFEYLSEHFKIQINATSNEVDYLRDTLSIESQHYSM